jgi:pyridoxine/pyridoxamine 5'-phosphate oxidase
MRKFSQQEIEEFLAKPLVCHLACLDDEGYPYVVPCLYLYADGGFYLTARERAAWAHHLQRDGRVSLCIDGDNVAARVQVKGVAERLDGPRLLSAPWEADPMYALGLRFVSRYSGSGEAARSEIEKYQAEPFWYFFIRPSRMTSVSAGDWAARYKHADRQY